MAKHFSNQSLDVVPGLCRSCFDARIDEFSETDTCEIKKLLIEDFSSAISVKNQSRGALKISREIISVSQLKLHGISKHHTIICG